MTSRQESFGLVVGGIEVTAEYLRPAAAGASLVIAHGAGSGREHPFLGGLAERLASYGVATLRFDFPYRAVGRRMPGPPASSVAAWRAAFAAATDRSEGEPVWASGKSYGGRMASVAVAEGLPAAGLVFFGYPLHPPGKPERLRDAHLYGLSLPMLFLQGTRDTFATPDLLTGVVERLGGPAEITWIEGGSHSFEVAGSRRDAAEIGASLAGPTAAFLRGHGAALALGAGS